LNEHKALEVIAKMFGSSPRFTYPRDDKRIRYIQHETWKNLSNALELGLIREYADDEKVELRLTQLGRRQLSAFKKWKARGAAA